MDTSKEKEIKIGDGLKIFTGNLGFQRSVQNKFEKIDYFLFSVVFILIVMVATLIIDSFHFNSATYTEYSTKLEAVKTTQEINQKLLEQIQKTTNK